MEPVALAVGGLLALLIGHELFSDDDSSSVSAADVDMPDDIDTPDNVDMPDDVDTPDDVDMPDDVDTPDDDDTVTPAEFTYDAGTKTLTGTGDDDYIDVDEERDTRGPEKDIYKVHGGAGDDTISDVDNYDDAASIHGDDGDDVITFRGGFDVVVDGGAGNDLLNVTPSSASILGGTGNDTINYSNDETHIYSNNKIDGGSGNDVIRAEADLRFDDEGDFPGSNVGVRIAGGEGADSISIVSEGVGLETVFDDEDEDAPPTLLDNGSGTLATISDFNPAEDDLTIQVSTGARGTLPTPYTMSYTGLQITEDAKGTTVALRYTVDGDASRYVDTLVRLPGAHGVTEDMIKIVTS